jgi:hypothetical protein
MKSSTYAWSFGKSKKHELEKSDKRYTPGPGMYSSSNKGLDKAPSWR